MSATVACISCGTSRFSAGVLERTDGSRVSVRVCLRSDCKDYYPVAMPPDMALAILALRDPAKVEVVADGAG